MKRRGFCSKMGIAAMGLCAIHGGASAQVLTQQGVPGGDQTHTRDFLESPYDNFTDEQKLAIAADEAFTRFRQTVAVSGKFMERSQGLLIFPQISRAGVLVGGARGDGMLVIRGQQPRFYRQEANSIGFQLGVQRYSQIYVFTQPQALQEFLVNPSKLNMGADATVAVGYAGAQDAIDTAQLNQPVVVFTFDNSGLMAGVSLSATKIVPKMKP